MEELARRLAGVSNLLVAVLWIIQKSHCISHVCAQNCPLLMIQSNLILTNRYDRRTIFLHWLTAGLVLSLWSIGQTIDWFPKGNPRSLARSIHIALGVGLALVLLRRVWWRSTGGVRLPPAGTSTLDNLAAAVHKVLYLLLFGTVALGIANAWIRGDTLFMLLKIPAFDPANKALRESVENWHSWAANILLVVAGLHAVAALLHHFVLQDSILRRMLPR